MQNLYELFGLTKEASQADVQGAYRAHIANHRSAAEAGDEDAQNQLKIARSAFEILSNEEQRRMYDQRLERQSKNVRPDPTPLQRDTPSPRPAYGVAEPGDRAGDGVRFAKKYQFVCNLSFWGIFWQLLMWWVLVIVTFGLALPFFVYYFIRLFINRTEMYEVLDRS